MDRTLLTPFIDIFHLLTPVLWLGLLVGVSFVATPVKFHATSLSLPVALDVGRVTFAFFNAVEWVALAFLVVAVVLSGTLTFPSVATALLAIVLIVQAAWLLPVLNERIAAIIAGHPPIAGFLPLSLYRFGFGKSRTACCHCVGSGCETFG